MQRSHAFSLVELSIVLVILGLLTGGILAGKSLIRASELRSVTTEYTRYVSAVQAFRDKYFYLPGDMPNATAVWGPADTAGNSDGKGTDCRVESTTTATCNGDGNGQVDSLAATPNAGFEIAFIWKHLANAGLIEGNYTGAVATAGSNTICINAAYMIGGCNAPNSKLSNGMWMARYIGSISSDGYLFDGDYGNALTLSTSPTNIASNQTFIKPEDLWNIDTKMDDGLPGTGKLVASRWNFCATGAASTADVSNARYNLTTASLCSAFFARAF